MRYLYILTIFFTAICSCKSKVSNSAVVNNVQQKDSTNVADTLYSFVSKIYKHNFMKTKVEVLDSLYLSSELYAFRKESYEFCPDTYHNHWINDKYAYYPSFKIGKITQLSDTTSLVDIKVSNRESKSEYQLKMLLENGKWKVDDFVTEFSTEKAIIRNQLGLEIPLRGTMSEYSLKYCEFAEETHEGAVNLYKNKTIVSRNIVEVGGNKRLDVIADTKDGFNILYSWGHNKYFGDTIFLFKYLKGQFYLYKTIRYYYTETEEGYDEKSTEEILDTPILFQDVDFENYLF